jgi:hypothetical protein
MLLEELNLSIGERAKCKAGYPRKSTVIVECKNDFSEAQDYDHIINNSSYYIKTVDGGEYGLLTSHLISSKWGRL